MRISPTEIRIYPLDMVKAILRHMGPEFWIVAIFPFYVSWVWGSGEIFPGLAWLEENPTQAGAYLSHFAAYMGQTWRFWVGAVVIGPFLGGGTVLFDDYFDREIDRANPRKNSLPFYKLPASPRIILTSAVSLFTLSLVLSALITPGFLVLSALIVVLSAFYSAPPTRLKSRGGLDLTTNMLGFGVLCSLAGFSIDAPLHEYPWLWLVPMVLGTGTLYILTTIADMEADGESDVRTIAVKLGLRHAVRMSMVLLLLANVGILSLGLMDYLYSPGVVYRVWPISVLEFVPLVHLYRRNIPIRILWIIFFTGSLQAIGTFLLALNHVGIWSV